MLLAIQQAHLALADGDVPVGAIVVFDGRIVGTGFNSREKNRDPLGHAELTAIRAASLNLDRWRLTGCTLYVTLEPCPMCAPAIVQARLDRLVFGAYDPKLGAAGTVFELILREEYPHRVEVIGGVREEECAEMLRNFFSRCRKDRD
ncbi:MAG TPA: tRNA-specific adenosine deaminase [Cyanobacteria bacterium UBA8530]|nr:tRNA-specific adenosine deaminase [Cyanobacteria bacterium UBA8530]